MPPTLTNKAPPSFGGLHHSLPQIKADQLMDAAQSHKKITAFQFLSLFLLLFSLFILLNTLVAPMQEGGSGKPAQLAGLEDEGGAAELENTDQGPPDQGRRTPQQAIDSIVSLYTNKLPAIQVETPTHGERLRIDYPANQLFVNGQNNMRGDRVSFFDALPESFLQTAQIAQIHIDIDYFLQANDDEVDISTSLPITRLKSLAQRLIKAGLSPHQLTTKITQINDGDDYVRIAFWLFDGQAQPEKAKIFPDIDYDLKALSALLPAQRAPNGDGESDGGDNE